MRKALGIAAAFAALLLVAGCTPKFDGKIVGTQRGENKVQIKFTICIRSSESNACADESAPRRGDDELRHLLAFRVPKGTDVPDTFRTRDRSVVYERNGSYGRELKKLAPTPDGTKWFGFASEPLVEKVADRARYRLRFRLPDDPGNVFKHRPVTGAAGTEPGQPRVDCGDDAFDPSKASGATAICITDPTKRKRVRKSLRIALD